MASARIVAIRALETISGLSVPAPAIAGAEILIPIEAPMTDIKTLRPTPIEAQTIGSTKLSYSKSFWFTVWREGDARPLIKLAKPLDPMKPKCLDENDQALEYQNNNVPGNSSENSPVGGKWRN